MLGDTTTQNFIKTAQSLRISPQVVAEWNYNKFAKNRIYGSFSLDMTSTSPIETFTASMTTTASSLRSEGYYYGSSEKNITAEFSDTNFKDMGSFSASTAYGYRITFFAKISSSGSYTNTLDSKMFINVAQYNSTAPLNSNEVFAVDIDDRGWSRHEIMVWPNESSANKIILSARVNNASTRVLISNFMVGRLKKHEIDTKNIFSVISAFSPDRPGDQLAEKSFEGNSLSKPLSKNIYNYPYNGSDSLSNVCYPSSDGMLMAPSLNKFTYFVDKGSVSGTTAAGIYCLYDNAIKTNKIVIKMLNGGGTSRMYSNVIINYELYTFNGSSWTKYTNPATIEDDGSLILYWSGSTWNQTESNALLSDDGRTLSPTTTIYGIGVRVTSVGIVDDSGTVRALSSLTSTTTIQFKGKTFQLNALPVDKTIRFLEVSPRLTLDVSDYIIDIGITKDMDSNNFPLPIGLATANSANLALDNVKRVDPNTSNIYTIFNDESGISALSKMCKKDVKFSINQDIYDPLGNKINSSAISMGTVYADTWSGGDSETTSVSCRDYAKFLMQRKSTDLLLMMDNPRSNVSKNQNQFSKIGYVIEHLLEMNGFSDYEIDRDLANYSMSHFYTENNQNVWELLQGMMLAYQLSASIDEDGILRFFNYLTLSSANTAVDLNILDTASGTTLPNIVSLSIEDRIYPSEIKAKYKIFSPKVSTDIRQNDIESIEFVSTRAPELLWSPSEPVGLGYATLREDLSSTDTVLKLDTTNWNSGIYIWPEYSGYAVLEQEIIKYDGVLHSYIEYGAVSNVSKSGNSVTATVLDHNFSVGDKVTLSKCGAPLNCDGGPFTVTSVPDGDTVVFDISTGIISPLPSGQTTPSSLIATLTTADLISSKTYVVRSAEDLQQLTYKISSQQNNNFTDYSFGIRNLGTLMNLERGQFGTKATSHLLYAAVGGKTANQQIESAFPNARFAKFSGSVCNQFLPTSPSVNFGPEVDSTGTNRMRYINLVSDTSYSKTSIMVDSADSNSYNEYRFHFKLSKNENTSGNDFVGVFFGYNRTTGSGIFINLKPETNNSDTVKTSVSLSPNGSPIATANFELDTMTEIKTLKRKDGRVVYSGGRPVYEVTGHVWDKFQEVVVKISGNNIIVTSNGKRIYWSVLADSTTSTVDSVPIPASIMGIRGTPSVSAKSIGFYCSNNTVALFKDMSAGGDDDFLVGRDLRFTKNLNPILFNGKYAAQNPFKFDTCPTVHGMKIIDTVFDKSPAFGMKVFAPVGGYELSNSNNSTTTTLYKVTESHSAVSNILYNSNRAKFLVINTGGQLLPLKSTTDNFAPLMLSGEILVSSQESEVKQSIDVFEGSEEIELSSTWFQSEDQVKSVLKIIAKNIPEGMTRYSVKIFGHPLVQVGDICTLYSSLNNITDSDDRYIVTGVNQSYDGGVDTTLTLRRIRW